MCVLCRDLVTLNGGFEVRVFGFVYCVCVCVIDVCMCLIIQGAGGLVWCV